MSRIGVIVGSTRPNRVSPLAAERVLGRAKSVLADHSVELIDLADVNLPFFDEALPPAAGPGANPHTTAWAARVAEYDGFVIVTPEYNAGYPAVLKNALDYLFAEWAGKPVAVVAYGWHGGARVMNARTPVLGNLKMIELPGVGIQFGQHIVDGAWAADEDTLAALDAQLDGLAARLGEALTEKSAENA